MLSAELPDLQAELARVELSLNEDLEAMNSGLSKLSRAPVQFKQSVQGISEQIAGVVVAEWRRSLTLALAATLLVGSLPWLVAASERIFFAGAPPISKPS